MNFLNREIVDFFAMWDMIDFFFFTDFYIIYLYTKLERN